MLPCARAARLLFLSSPRCVSSLPHLSFYSPHSLFDLHGRLRELGKPVWRPKAVDHLSYLFE